MIIKDNIKYMPVKELAEHQGVTVQCIYKQIREGRIKSYKIGSFILGEAK